LTKSSVLDGKAKRARSYQKFCARIHDQKQITDSSHPAFCVACMFEGLVHEQLANCCWDVVAYHLVELGFERSRGVFLCPMGMVSSRCAALVLFRRKRGLIWRERSKATRCEESFV